MKLVLTCFLRLVHDHYKNKDGGQEQRRNGLRHADHTIKNVAEESRSMMRQVQHMPSVYDWWKLQTERAYRLGERSARLTLWC
jgi:hypothetical protein